MRNSLLDKFAGLAAGIVIGAAAIGALLLTPQCFSAPGEPASQTEALPAAVSRENATVLAVKKVAPAVVNISTEAIVRRRPPNPFAVSPFSPDFFDSFFNPPRQRTLQNLGSGFLFDPRGYILTNEHVVAQAVKVKVLLVSDDEYDAVIVGSDQDLDLAVLKVDVKGKLPCITPGRSDDLMIGEDVMAIGNPFGLSHTVTRGVLSAVNRSIQVGNRSYEHLLQTDAAINPGNSGGPLLNVLGEVIGVNSAIHGQAEGIGFAIPIDEAMKVAGDLVLQDQSTAAWFGVTALQFLQPELRASLGYGDGPGLVVAGVFPGSPADRAGIGRGDVLVGMDGEELEGFPAFLRLLGKHKAGETVSFGIFRGGKKIQRNVKLEVLSVDTAARLAWERFGFRLSEISLPQAAQLGLSGRDGMLVTEVRYGGPAHAAGLAPGDVLIALNSNAVTDEESFVGAVLKTMWHRGVMAGVVRDRHSYWVPITASR